MDRLLGAIICSTFAPHPRNLSNERRRINDMKKRSLILAAVALVAVMLAVPLAFAQHMHARGMGMRGGELGPVMMLGHLEHAREALGLSDQQVTDIKAIFKDFHAQN